MKELEFRVWDDKVQKMHYREDNDCCFVVDIFGNAVGVKEDNNFILDYKDSDHLISMLAIGLTDKNNKHIYDLDFVIMHQFLFDGNEVESELFGLVEYNNEYACFELTRIQNKEFEDCTGYDTGQGATPISNFLGTHEESFEVMGNYYQNTKLMKTKS